MLCRGWRYKGYVPEQVGNIPILSQSRLSSFFSFLLLLLLSSSLNADYRGEGGAMDGEGRSQIDYYTVRVSNPSSSGEAYFIVSAIAVYTYKYCFILLYIYNPVYNLGLLMLSE